MKRENEDWEVEELEEMEPEEQEDGWEADADGQTGQVPLKTSTMILVFSGLVVLAAIICGILWGITHRDRGSDPGNGSIQGTTEDASGADEDREPGGESESLSEETGTGQKPEGGEDSSEPGDGPESQPVESDGAGGDVSQDPGAENGDAGSSSQQPDEGNGGTDSSQEPDQGNNGADPSREPDQGNNDADPSQEPDQGNNGTDLSQEPDQGNNGADLSQEPDQGNNGTDPSRESDSASQTASNDANRVSTMDGRVIVFTDCDDTVSPKEYVNLRSEPSTSEGNATVNCRLNYGETVHRTGISEDSGWSRVEKDGVVCYVVSSLVYVVEE